MRLSYRWGITCIWLCVIWWIVTWAIIRDTKPIIHLADRIPLGTWVNSGVFMLETIKPLSGLLFSSPKESFDQRKQIIGSTTWYLNGWMYDITYNRAKLPLIKLAESKIPIRLILEDQKYQSFGNSYIGTKALLEDAWVQIMSDSDLGLGTNFVHAKVFVSPSWWLIQTANLTKWWFNTSREYYTYLTDSWVVQNLQQLFDADWRWKPLIPSQIHPNILVCPINCRATIQWLINWAKSSILIQNQYIEDPQLTILLQSKSHITWFNLRTIVADNEFAQPTLNAFGTKAVWILTSPYPHAKMMLIDDTYLLISSINFSTNSMDHNREIWIILTNRDAIDYFKSRFNQDSNKSKSTSSFKKTYSSWNKL